MSLQPRVFDLLVFLIEQRHRAVDKDEIQDAVWAPMIVSETALTRAIMKARRAVGDDADTQQAIRTVHGHGYQFVAPLAEPAAVAEAEVPPKPIEVAAAAPGPRRAGLALAALTIVAIVAVALWPGSPRDAAAVRVAVLPIANDTGDSEYDWARLGLMGLAHDYFADTDVVDTVATSDVVSYVDNSDWSGAIDSADALDQAARLRRAFGASHVLFASLEAHVGGLRLSYTLVDASGPRAETTMVSAQSTPLVRGMVTGVSNLLGGRRYAPEAAMAAIDDDPFINEAYARAVATALEGRCAEAAPLFDVVLARNGALDRARMLGAGCRFELGESDVAQAAFEDLLQRDSVRADPGLHAEVLRRLGMLHHRSGRHEAAEVAYNESRATAAAAGDKEALGRALISSAILAKDRRQFDTARDWLSQATLHYRQLEWQVLPGSIASTLANIAMNAGELDAAEQHLDDALVSFRALGDRANEAKMLNNYGFLRRLQGRFSEAEPLHLQSLEIRREIGDRVGQGRILNFLSILYQREGRHEAALTAADEAVAIAREADDQLFLATGLAQRGAAERSLKRYETSIATYMEAGDIFMRIEDVSRALQVRLRLARIDIERGDTDSAATRVADVLETALAADLPEPAIEAMRYAGDMAWQRDDVASARDYYERGLSHVEQTGFESLRMPLAQRLASIYLDVGDLDAAASILGFLVEQEPSVYNLTLQARYAHLTGDAVQAVTFMSDAKALAGDAWADDNEQLLTEYRTLAAQR
ncbi:MAG: tetratricopeptide repeat protein [Pseudomonadota bacterium]